MPSSHAQFMTFFAVYVTLYLIHRFGTSMGILRTNLCRTTKISLLLRLGHCFVVIVGSSVVSLSRMYLRYHTARQVLIGVGVGAISGVIWYVTVLVLRGTGWVDWVLHFRAAEMLWFKDGDIGSLEHDLYEEWVQWRKGHEKQNTMTKKTQ